MGMNNPIALTQAQARRLTASDFKNSRNIAAGMDNLLGKWFGILRNPVYPAIAPDKNHIKRNIGVAHPHGDFPRRFIEKKHSVPRLERTAKHQSFGIRFRRVGNLNLKSLRPGAGDNFDCLALQRLGQGCRRLGPEMNCAQKPDEAREADEKNKKGRMCGPS